MSENTGNRGNGWKWVAIALLALIVIMATCVFSALGGGLFGFVIGRGTAQRAETSEYSYEEPWVYPYEDEQELPYDLESTAWLGVVFASGEDGAGVTAVIGESPADSAGIQVGDIITEVDGEPVTLDYPLDAHILSNNPGDRVELTLLRDGDETIVSVRLGSRSDSELEWDDEGQYYPYQEPLIPDIEG